MKASGLWHVRWKEQSSEAECVGDIITPARPRATSPNVGALKRRLTPSLLWLIVRTTEGAL